MGSNPTPSARWRQARSLYATGPVLILLSFLAGYRQSPDRRAGRKAFRPSVALGGVPGLGVGIDEPGQGGRPCTATPSEAR